MCNTSHLSIRICLNKYDIQAATSNNGTAATSYYLDVQTNVTKYKRQIIPVLDEILAGIYTPIPFLKS